MQPVPVCKNHLDRMATWRCPICMIEWCDTCIVKKSVNKVSWCQCPTCCEKCSPIINEKEPEPLVRQIPDILKYPFRGGGWILLATGTAFCMILKALAGIFIGGLVFVIIGGGYFSAYLFKIINASAAGESELPDWPDFTNLFDDVLRPFAQMLATNIVSFAPLLVYFTLATLGVMPSSLIIAGGLFILGLAYLPMALIALAVTDSVWALNPVIIVSMILKIPREYTVSGLFLIVATILNVTIQGFATFIPIPTSLFHGFVTFYFLTIEMRILGLICEANRKRFDELGINF